MANHGGKRPGAGRPKGSKNKRTQQVDELLDEMDCDPIEGMAKIALGEAECFVCQQGKVSYVQFCKYVGLRVPSGWSDQDQAEVEELATQDMTCPACGGTGQAVIDTKQRADMFKELAQYVAPKRKATELSGNVGVGSHEEWLDKLK